MRTLLVMVVALALTACSHVESDWKIAETQNTVDGYATFLARYPQGTHSADAQRRLDLLKVEEGDWGAAHQGDPIEAFGQFLQKHPKSRHREEILALMHATLVQDLQHLVGRFETWNDTDRKLEQGILIIDPNNPYALSLLGFDRFRQGRSEGLKDIFIKAVANSNKEKVSDISKICVARGDPGSMTAKPFRVVRPIWDAPEADAERKRIEVRSKAGPDWPEVGSAIAIENGKCETFLLFSEATEDSGSAKRTLKYWIDGWASSEKGPGDVDFTPFFSQRTWVQSSTAGIPDGAMVRRR